MKTIKEYNAFEIANWYGCKELTDEDKFLSKKDVLELIEEMPLTDVEDGQVLINKEELKARITG